MIRGPYILTFIILITDLFLNPVKENTGWQLSKSEKQISIYTRHVDYSDYKEFKAEMTISCKPDSVITFIRNIDSFKKWLPDCLESKKLAQISTSEQINYVLTDVPWPFEDRDIVYQFTVVDKDSESKQFRIILENKPKYIALKKNIVRIPKSKGFWTITPISANQTKVEYQMHVEPGGFVPAWLANLKIVDTPFTFLYNLREQIEKK